LHGTGLQSDAFVEDLDESDVRAAGIGSRVWLKDESGSEDRFTIARYGEEHPEPRQMSLAPAIRRALLGRWAGEQVHVWTPAGARVVTIVEVD
jgi:transcription elongation GreA/GreB family factor